MGAPVTVVAHRGASSDAPENTIPAFTLAWELGADAIEGDFHLTADGAIVCWHDKDLRSINGSEVPIANYTLAQLQAIDLGVRFGEPWQGLRMPSLAEVIAVVPEDKQIFIEIKCGSEIAKPLVAQLRNSPLKPQQVLIIAFDWMALKRVKDIAPEYATSALASLKKTTIAAYLKVGMRYCKVDAIGTNDASPLSKSFIRKFTQSGYGYHIWTVDDPARANELALMGISSITTNNLAGVKAAF